MKRLQVNIRIGVFTVQIELQHFLHAVVMAGGGMNIILYFFNVRNNYQLCVFINSKKANQSRGKRNKQTAKKTDIQTEIQMDRHRYRRTDRQAHK